MEPYPWWNEEHKKLAVEIKKFVNEVIPRDEESRYKREFPWDILEKAGERGFGGVSIAKEYGGMELGAIGACIVVEEMGRMPGLGRAFTGNMLGGLRQIELFGTEEQKKRWLPEFAEGKKVGAICITEPLVGTDAAGIETVARREGDKYLITGKKRYIVSAGMADRHMLYAKTSNDPEDRRRYRHLTGFIVEKGMPGFTTERIYEIIGFDNIQNGVLNLDNVPVPMENRIGEEGDGWKIMMAGLNFERTLIAALVIGWLREVVRAAVPYTQRRVQFGRPTSDLVNNQLKIADLFIKLKMARLGSHYNAYLHDLGHDIALSSAGSKVFNCESAVECARAAMQIMGGDGVNKLYSPWVFYNLGKVEEIAGGTMEACRLIAYRMGLSEMAEDIKMPRRVVHEELGVPITTYEKPEKLSQINEDALLKMLAEDYRVNPGLHMTRGDIKDVFDVDDKELDRVLVSLEEKGLAILFRGRKGIELAKATYQGLNKAHPIEYYQWFPSWVDERRRF
ncbi:MAG: acyl-CoA dehydrogenase family protein [Pseudomonadota bacterium]